MFAIASLVAFVISWGLYALHNSIPAPWDSHGFELIGFICLAAQFVRRPWS